MSCTTTRTRAREEKALEAMIRYAHRHGMIREPMAPEALFFPPSLETTPVGHV